MPLRATLALPILFIAGCASSDYIGETHPSTTEVHIYFHDETISAAHSLMGQIRADGARADSFEEMERALARQAMEHGADAIVLMGMEFADLATSDSDSHGGPAYVLGTDGALEKIGDCSRWSSSEYTSDPGGVTLTATLIQYLE